jgi:hypothetical protein
MLAVLRVVSVCRLLRHARDTTGKQEALLREALRLLVVVRRLAQARDFGQRTILRDAKKAALKYTRSISCCSL